MPENPLTAARPLSPHLQVYRPLINMMMSIAHRITGVALYAGSALLACWLIAAAFSPEQFALANAIFASWPGKLVLFGFTFALFHHLVGGIRHLIWDTGRGFDLKTVDLMSWGTPVVSIGLTLAVWTVAVLA